MNPERNTQKLSDPPSLDLDRALQVKNPYRRGEQVWEECFEAVTPEMIEYTATLIHGKRGPQEPWYDLEPTQNRLKNLAANQLFLDTFDEIIADSPDVSVFQQRLGAFFGLDKRMEHLVRGKSGRLKSVQLTKFERGKRGLDYLHMFCEKHPELETQAIDGWVNVYAANHKMSDNRLDRPGFMNEAETLVKRAGLSREFKDNRIARLVAVDEGIRLKKGTPNQYKTQESLKSMLTSLDKLPYEAIGTSKLESIRALLEASTDMRQPAARTVLLRSLGATTAFVRNLAIRETVEHRGASDNAAHHMYQLINKEEQKNTISYAWLTKLANVITPALAKSSGLEFEKLNPSDLADYPQAVDRIVSYTMHASLPSLEAKGNLKTYQLAADCVKLTALRGAQHKVGEGVMTIGDVILRYPELTAEEQTAMIERLQKTQGKLGATAVQGLYRKLTSGNKRNRSRYSKWQPGYGLFS